MVFSSTFVCPGTGKMYYIRGNVTCNSTNAIYLVECIIGNINMLGLPLLLNKISVFMNQILKQRRIVVGPRGTLILFAAIQLILMVT